MMRTVFIICLALFISPLLPAPAFADGAVSGSFSTADNISPAAVIDLSIAGRSSNSITLRWTAPGDDASSGTAAQYAIRYSISPITSEADWDAATPAVGIPSPHLAGSIETVEIPGLAAARTFWFALKTADDVPNWSALSNTASGTTTEAFPEWWLTWQPTVTGVPLPEPPVPPRPRMEIRIDDELFFGELDEKGALLNTEEFMSADGAIGMMIQEGTLVTDEEDNHVNLIVIEPGGPFVGTQEYFKVLTIYRFEPSAIFTRPILLKLRYDPQALSDPANEANLRLALYEPAGEGWLILPSSVDDLPGTVQGWTTSVSTIGLLEPRLHRPAAPVIPAAAPQAPPQPVPARLRAVSLALDSREVNPGESVTVTARVINEGDLAGAFNVPIMVDGLSITVKNIYLEPRQEKNLVARLTAGKAGLHQVEIGTLRERFMVTSIVPPVSARLMGFPGLLDLTLTVMVSGAISMVILTYFERRRRKKRPDTRPTAAGTLK
ncbi:MAG TPA: hypothetical protein VJ377_05275 [Dehalococcoidales bacterium]|nr:hypothetical protein [Dehalococcoidales bacterium]